MFESLLAHYDVILLSLSCFFVSFLFLPFTKNFVSFDVKIISGVYCVIWYLFSFYVYTSFSSSSFFSYPELLFLLFVVLFFITYLVCLIIHFSLENVDSRFVGSLFTYGFLSLCLGLKQFSLFTIVIAVLIFLVVIFKLLDSLNLISVRRTLMMKCTSIDTVDQLKLALKMFNASIISTKVHRGQYYIFSCEYRLNNLSQHIFSRHMFNKKDICEIVFYEQ